MTLLGRINIVKTLGISKLVYNTSVLVVPPNFDKEVNNACFRFVWNFKPDKIKRSTLIGPFDKDGLQMVDFSMVDKVLKAAWVKRLYEETHVTSNGAGRIVSCSGKVLAFFSIILK